MSSKSSPGARATAADRAPHGILQLRMALERAKPEHSIPCTIQIRWRINGEQTRMQGPLATTMKVLKGKGGEPVLVWFGAIADDFDPRSDIEADFGRPEVPVFAGERCVVIPLEIDGERMV